MYFVEKGENQVLDAGLQARLRRVIPVRNRKFEVLLMVGGVSAVVIASIVSFAFGVLRSEATAISDRTLMDAVVLATCEGQTPASVYVEASKAVGNHPPNREAMLTFLIDRARDGSCGVLENNSVERKLVRRAPGDG